MVLFAKNLLAKNYMAMYRAFSTTKPKEFSEMLKLMPKRYPIDPHHTKSTKLWRNLFFLVALPGVVLVNLNIMFFEDHHPKRPDFKPYEYMRKRAKPFPWGDGNHSLFHNPYYNALPEGYETPDHEEAGEHH